VTLLAVLLAGCNASPYPSVPPSALALLASLDTPDGIVDVFRDTRGMHLWLGQDTGGQNESGLPPSVHLFSTGGESGLTYNSFVFGVAPSGATQVELSGIDYIGATVTNDVYVMALEAKDILPTQLVWTFRNGQGDVISRGSNITP